MKKNILKLTIILLLAVGIFLSLFIIKINTKTSTAANYPTQEKTVYVFRDPSVIKDVKEREKYEKFDTPLYFVFDATYGGNQRKEYGNQMFFENRALDKYAVYQMKNPFNIFEFFKTSRTLDYFYLLENKQTANGNNGWKLVNNSYSKNLKLGKVDANDQTGNSYSGDNKGNMVVQTGNYKGKNYEFRYLGYTFTGTEVTNPEFPPDIPNDLMSWNCNWIKISSWKSYSVKTEPSPYAPGGFVEKKELLGWFIDYLFEDPSLKGFQDVAINKIYPGQSNSIKAKIASNKYCDENYKLAEYWSERLMWTVDPVKGTGMLIGWHIKDGGTRYRTIVVKSENKRNMRLTELTVYDSSNNVIAKTTRDAYAESTKETTTINNKYIRRGENYKVVAKMKNMTSVVNSRTNTTPITIQNFYIYDDEIYKQSPSILDIFSPVSIDMPEYVESGKTATFQWTFELSTDCKKEVKIATWIPGIYYENYDNYNLDDDDLSIILETAPEDLEIKKEDIVLIDQWGNETEDVIPGEVYSIEYKVRKVMGSKPVGQKGDYDNPYVTINATYDDGYGKVNIGSLTATQTLYPNGVVNIPTKNKFSPRSPTLTACAIIDPLHNEYHQNDITTNDSACRTWIYTNNFSVKDLTISPANIVRSSNVSAGTEDLNFSFKATYEALNTGYYKNVKVVLKKEGTVIKSGYISLKPGVPFVEVNWEVKNVPLFYGDVNFEVEINPAPREYVETFGAGRESENPYADNKTVNAINVNQNASSFVCNVENTKNTWTQNYSVYEWRGHLETYDYSYYSETECTEGGYRYKEVAKAKQIKDDDFEQMEKGDVVAYGGDLVEFKNKRLWLNGYKTNLNYNLEDVIINVREGRVLLITWKEVRYCAFPLYIEKECERCVNDPVPPYDPSPKVPTYEEYKIKNIYFKSKVTTDTEGGWVDLLTRPNRDGKIKAGYGFELKVVVNYNTNRYSAGPYEPWSDECSGKTVSPYYTKVYMPTNLSLKLPYATYVLTGSASGNWDNRTVTYQLPLRDAFGIKNVPQIFVNETAKNGMYPMEIITQPFAGVPDKPSGNNKVLCDKETVYLNVVGGGTEDLKTHIIQ